MPTAYIFAFITLIGKINLDFNIICVFPLHAFLICFDFLVLVIYTKTVNEEYTATGHDSKYQDREVECCMMCCDLLHKLVYRY